MMRTAFSAAAVCVVSWGAARGEMQPQWFLDLPARKPAWEHTSRMRRDVAHPLLAQEDLLLVGCEHNGALLALDLDTGSERWRFYTGGPVRVDPAGDGRRFFVTSDDGYLYALDRQGKLLWKHRGGPSDRKVLAHERLASAWPGGADLIAENGKVFFVAGHWPVDGVYVHALDATTGDVLWSNSSPQYRPHGATRKGGDRLFVYGHGGSGAYDIRTGQSVDERLPRLEAAELLTVPGNVEGQVVRTRMHDGRLIAATLTGRIYCFADRDPREGTTAVESTQAPVLEAADKEIHTTAARLLERTGVREGYAVVIGLADGALVEGLLRGSDLRVIAIDRDAKRVAAVRRRLDERGLFDDHRLSVLAGDAARRGLPPCMASLITTETDLALSDALREVLRPFGGTFAAIRGDKVTIERRDGPIPNTGQWTHEYADAANSLCSQERVVRAPLGILWYEGPASDARFYYDGHVDHQSGHSVSPLPPGAAIVDGRMILEGPGRLAAFDIYTGRLLWETEIPKVYGFGGPGGGVGIHSKNHREPWRHEEAMRAEIPATFHSRTTGLNFTSSSDAIYVCAGRELLCFRPTDGSRQSVWKVPLPEAEKEDLCWGSVRLSGDLIIATVFRPHDLVDAQCGHDGNGGDWSKDRMPMRFVLGLDRASGNPRWSRRAEWGFLNRGMAAGGGMVFCVDTIAPHTLEKLREASRRLPRTPPMLYALDLNTGRPKWHRELDVAVLNLTYAERSDTLVVPCRNLMTWHDGHWLAPSKEGKPGRNTPGRMLGIRGKTGDVVFEVDEAPYFEPHVILGDVLLDRYGYTYDLRTGRRHERVDPRTGQKGPWHFRKGGCNHLVACPALITWRTAVYDLAGQSGSMQLHGMDMGCTPTMLPAGGVLNVPNFGTHHKRSRMTALALVHRPGNRLWTQYDTSREKSTAPPAPLRRAGFNFGAPGDRFAEDGTLWLSVTSRKKENTELAPKEPAWFRVESALGDSWIASTGVEGVLEVSIPLLVTSDKRARRADNQTRRYDVRLHFIEPDAVRSGERVFSVAVEGRSAVVDLDVAKAAGGPGRPLVRELKNIEVQGPLDLSFTASRGKPVLCGVEVRSR